MKLWKTRFFTGVIHSFLVDKPVDNVDNSCGKPVCSYKELYNPCGKQGFNRGRSLQTDTPQE